MWWERNRGTSARSACSAARGVMMHVGEEVAASWKMLEQKQDRCWGQLDQVSQLPSPAVRERLTAVLDAYRVLPRSVFGPETVQVYQQRGPPTFEEFAAGSYSGLGD